MTDEPNKTERRLKGSDGQTPDLRGVIGDEDPEDVDIFGYQVIYTTGDFEVPREDLLDKIEQVGLPDWMAPGQVEPYRAFGRMIDDIREKYEEIVYDGHRCQVRAESGDSRYVQHIHVDVFQPAEDEDTDDPNGEWITHRLGVIHYNSDTQSIQATNEIDGRKSLGNLWHGAEREDGSWKNGIKDDAVERFHRHQELHTGDDVNNMVYYLCRQWTDAVKLRDSCYFVPASYDDIGTYIDGFRILYDWINQNYKTRGQATELFAIEIIDTQRQRQMVEEKVRAEIEGEVGDIFDNLVEEFHSGTAPDAVAQEVVQTLDQVEGLAERHSAMLKTELSVKRAMKDRLDEITDEEREEVVENVLAEAGLDPRDEVEA